MIGFRRLWPPWVLAVALFAARSGHSGEPVRDLRTRQQASAEPSVTLLYQNFPNPFPTAASATTCIWFDLSHPSIVRLAIHDIRGNLVRRIVPGAAGTATSLPAGRYGRGSTGNAAGCDLAYSWDGRDDAGRLVANGVYLLRLEADSFVGIKKILFRGR